MTHAPLRILAIAPTAFYNDYGCHIRIMGQLRGLQARGHRIRLVTYPVGRDLPDLTVTRAPLPGLKQLSVGSSRIKVLLDAILGPPPWFLRIAFARILSMLICMKASSLDGCCRNGCAFL